MISISNHNIKTFKTSALIIISSLISMIIMFFAIGSNLYRHLSVYVLNQSAKYTDSITEQVQQRLNSMFSEIDSNLQQFCNDTQVQRILYNSCREESLTSDEQSALRRKIMETLNYTDSLQSIDIYSAENPQQLYPYGQESLLKTLSITELNLIDKENGKIVWFTNENSPGSSILAGKKLLLSDYQFVHGGYIVARIKTEFLDFFQKDFNELENSAILLTDGTGNTLYFSADTPEVTQESISESNDYRLVKTLSAYTNWELTIYIPNNILKQDLPWLNHTLFMSFRIGGVTFLICCILIAHMISSPIRDMKKAMFISNGKLQKNLHRYLNSDINELNSHYNKLVDKNNDLIQEVYEKELLKTKAEINALQSQVNPHFIINALESVYWCLIKKGDMENSQILLSLARLFRYILKSNDWIPLTEELNFIEEYLQIEQFRFGAKLKWKYDIAPSLSDISIPKLLIHPLVENSVKYAVETMASEICIKICVQKTNTHLEIIVSDNGPGISKETMDQILLSFRDDLPVGSVSKSYGLANLYKRIHLYFGENSRLIIQSLPKRPGTAVIIQIDDTFPRPYI